MKLIVLFLMLFYAGLTPTSYAFVNPQTSNAEMKKHAADLPQTLVVRTNESTGKIDVYHSRTRLSQPASVATLPAFDDSLFTPVENSNAGGGSANSPSAWYWNFSYNYGYPYYGYYGYNYNYYPYYSYYSYPYYYSYYGWW